MRLEREDDLEPAEIVIWDREGAEQGFKQALELNPNLAEGSSIEKAVEAAAKDASETVRNIKHVYVNDIQAIVENGSIQKYRVNCKVTFVVSS